MTEITVRNRSGQTVSFHTEGDGHPLAKTLLEQIERGELERVESEPKPEPVAKPKKPGRPKKASTNSPKGSGSS